MRVLIFTDTYLPEINGVSLTLSQWVDWLKTRGIPVKVIAPHYRTLKKPGDRAIVRNTSFPFFLYPEVRLACPHPKRLKGMIDAFNPTVCHIATPGSLGLYGRYYGKKNRIPLVASYHTHFDRYLNYYRMGALLPVLEKYMFWFHQPFARIYVPSHETMAHLRNMGLTSLELFPRGVDFAQFHPSRNRQHARTVIKQRYRIAEEKLLLYVGRLAPEKDLDVLFAALKRVPSRWQKKAHVIVVGDGPLRQQLEQTAAELHVPVTFTGFQKGKSLTHLYQSADLFVFPSSTETYGNVVQEAMASRVAVLGVNQGGVSELIQHGQNGWLARPRDPQSLAEAITTLLDDDRLRVQLAGRGYALIQTKSWPAIFVRLLQSYESVVALHRQHVHKERMVQ